MKIRIGIIENNRSLCVELAKKLDKDRRFEVCFILYDTRDAIRCIFEKAPDVLVITYEMPGSNAQDVLREMNRFQRRRKPYIIVTSEMQDNMFIHHLASEGMCDFIQKPYTVDRIMDRLGYIHECMNRKDTDYTHRRLPESLFSDRFAVRESRGMLQYHKDEMLLRGACYSLLTASGFQTTSKGFSYIVSAVMILYARLRSPVSATKELYPELSLMTFTNPATVERNIRSSIAKAWDTYHSQSNGSSGKGNLFDVFREKPGNMEFLTHLTACVRNILENDEVVN